MARKRKSRSKEIRDYDEQDTTAMIDPSRSLQFEDLGLEQPKGATTRVVSIRLPSPLLNQIKAFASQRDVPYQAVIKLFLAESLERRKKKKAA